MSTHNALTWQLRGSLLLFVVLAIVSFVIVGVSAYLKTILLTWPFMLSVWGAYRAANRFFLARHSLQLLGAKPAALPKATLLSK